MHCAYCSLYLIYESYHDVTLKLISHANHC